ncbi:MAG: hypothetical protein MUF16_06235 [Burkholderiaceae bacterium]|nr:hypothetical protein [Burkholderiaceae bacterium]
MDARTGNPVETVLYRIYVPDRGMDCAGGLPVPTAKLALADGWVTFVESSRQDRPKHATAECGVGWVNWSMRGDGVGNPAFGWLSIRNMLPEPGTSDNFFAFKRPGDERAVLGDHYPQLKCYADADAFDALGCGGAATQKAMADIPAKGSARAVGWPYVAR